MTAHLDGKMASVSSCKLIDDSFGPYAGDCRGGFDFTQLFEESILIVPINVLLLLSVPWRTAYLLRKNVVTARHNILLYCKLICHVLLFGAQLGALVLWTQPTSVNTKATVPVAAVSLASSLGLIFLSCLEHTYAYQPSTILSLFLLLSAVFEAARTRTLWLQDYNSSNAVAALVRTVLIIVTLAFESIEKRSFIQTHSNPIPVETTSGILSKWFFIWQIPLLRTGYSKHLEVDDLYKLDKHLKTRYLQDQLYTKWDRATKKNKYHLQWTVLNSLKWPILSAVFPRLCYIGFTFCQPFLISTTLSWSDADDHNNVKNRGYGLIGAWFLVFTGIAISMGQYQHFTYRAIAMVRGQLISALYDKSLEMSITAADPTAALTLMSADIERIDFGWRTGHEVWANLVEMAIAIYLLERELGIACLVPLGLGVVSIVGSIIAVSFVMNRQAIWLEAIEKRIAVTSQMLGAIKAVKMCGLTGVLRKKVQGMRDEELRVSGGFRRLLIWNMGLAYLAPLLAPILTFMTYSLIQRSRTGGNLDSNKIFTALSLFALLQEPLTSFVTSLSTLVGSVGSFVRIQAFLESDARVDDRFINSHDPNAGEPRSSGSSHNSILEKHVANDSSSTESPNEKEPITHTNQLSESKTTPYAFTVQAADFGYGTTKEPTLRDINLEIPTSKTTMLIGPVGSGKSTLLKALLGEVSALEGSVRISNRGVAYCDQSPWHMNGTVRDSILGFSDPDERWYQQVLEACALKQDLLQFFKGDQTRIGSKGIILSGGQSQRISLARAVYARKDIIILDDVFSGLDAHTENVVFHNLLGTNGILRKSMTTVIIASSRTKRLPYADHIISLDGTHIGCQQGSFEELSTAASGYISQAVISAADWTYVSEQAAPSTAGEETVVSQQSIVKDEVVDPELDAAADSRQTGDWAVYKYYVGAIGWIPTFLFMFFICSFVYCQSFPTIWVNWWANANERHPFQRLGYYLGIYAMLSILALLFLVVSCWQMIVTMVPLSGKTFHWNLLDTVLNAPMSFFTQTDSGVTINRFSQDLQLIDMDLPLSALNTFATFVLCIAQLALLAAGSPYTAISFPFLLAALWVVQRAYLRTSRQIRFLDLEAKSPLYALFTESIQGLTTLRAFGWEKGLGEKHHRLLDRSQRPYYLLYAIQRWLTLVLDLFVAGIAVLLIVLVTQLRGVLPSSLTGVALINVILFSQSLKLLMTFWTTLETHIGAISRIRTFTTTTASEHEPQEKEHPPDIWPSRGTIEFNKVSAGYTESESILKNVTFSVKAGQKIGICGRTGSGKSSTVSCLFRMVDIHAGSITVDGQDITTLPRETVRSKIVCVPQETFLIDGSSVRMNADPEEHFSDAAIEEALKLVELWEVVAEKGGLDIPIQELHLSHGQRQLFCFARAVLRPSSIVVLDEATSSVDSKAEELIQRVVRERFFDRTIVAIVHKLESAAEDYDMIAVLDAGELIEFGPPSELLDRGPGGSAFAALYHGSVIGKSDQDHISGKMVSKKSAT